MEVPVKSGTFYVSRPNLPYDIMRRTSSVLGLVLCRATVKGKREALTVALADSAGQALVTSKIAANLLQDSEFSAHIEKMVGFGQASYDVAYFPATVSVACNAGPKDDTEISSANVEVGIIPGLSADADSDRSGISMFLGYDAMQQLGVIPNTAQVDRDGDHFQLKVERDPAGQPAHYALNPDKVRPVLNRFLRNKKIEYVSRMM